MESKANYTIVGLAVLILTAGLITTSLWLSLGFEHKEYDMYTVYVRESVSGLTENSPVKFNGVKVGVVSKIEINQFDPQEVKLELEIEEGTPITTTTHATLVNQGITGTTYLGLTASSPSLFPIQKTPGEPYPVIPYQQSFFGELEKNIHDISSNLKRILSKENIHALKETLNNLEKISAVFAQNDSNINRSLRDLPKLIQDFTTAGKEFTLTMKTGKDSIDKISQQALPPMIELFDRFATIAANLEKVSVEMRQNPAVVIRGTSPPKPGPGE